MSRNEHYKIPIILLFTGGYLLWRGLINFRKARRIEDTARIDIDSAPQGLVEIEGYAWPMSTPLMSVSGRRVVYYNYKVQEYVRRGKNSSWETKYEFHHTVPFYVIDQSGVCLVNPLTESMDLIESTIKLSSYAESIEELRLRTNSVTGFFATLLSGSYRLVEKKILIGSPVYICGDLKTNNLTQANLRGDYKKFLVQVKAMNTNPIFKSGKLDKNRDGFVSDEEFVNGLSDVSADLVSADTQQSIRLVGAISQSDAHNLIIAEGHQEQVLKRISSYNNLKIIGGIILIGLGFYTASLILQ